MIYAKGKDFVRDYILRTKENCLRLEQGPYEVTQLINSAIGLLIIPQQKLYNEIANNMISEELKRNRRGIPSCSLHQLRMTFNRFLNPLWFNTNIPLCDRCAAMLQ